MIGQAILTATGAALADLVARHALRDWWRSLRTRMRLWRRRRSLRTATGMVRAHLATESARALQANQIERAARLMQIHDDLKEWSQ